MEPVRCVVGILVCASLPAYVAAQSADREAPVKVASAAPNVPIHNPMLPQSGPPPRNADGHPDLNGMWDFLTGTPVERPPEFGDRLFMTAGEAAAYHQQLRASSNTDLVNPGTLVGDTENVEFEDIEADAYNKGMNNAWFDYAGRWRRIAPRLSSIRPMARSRRSRRPPRRR